MTLSGISINFSLEISPGLKLWGKSVPAFLDQWALWCPDATAGVAALLSQL